MPIAPELVTVLLAAGGRSSRFGRDKASFPARGQTLLDRMAGEAQQVIPDILVGLPPQAATEPDAWAAVRLKYRIIEDTPPGVGPIGCLRAGLAVAKTPWVLLLAVDLPGLMARDIRHLLELAEDNHSAVAAAARSTLPEPLCALYHRKLAPAVERAVQACRYSMQEILRAGPHQIVPIRGEAVHNMNHPEDIPGD
ncbi:MAG: molybdopterin-guanine dinucleotide biosynthesis protein A [Rhodothermales bacterium]|jgi:molybdopterin-guanine dinucleotide biosynthesis protein A